MSWREAASRGTRRRRPYPRPWAHLRAAAPLLLLLLAACGFQPLYGRAGADDPGTAEVLASIRVLPIAERSGQQLYNQLIDRLTPYGRPSDPRYLLTVDVSAATERLALREDETATRANLHLRANYQLRRASDNAVVYSATSRSTSAYDILEHPFASRVSEEDAFDRATRELSEEIRTRLAVFLSTTVADAP